MRAWPILVAVLLIGCGSGDAREDREAALDAIQEIEALGYAVEWSVLDGPEDRDITPALVEIADEQDRTEAYALLDALPQDAVVRASGVTDDPVGAEYVYLAGINRAVELLIQRAEPGDLQKAESLVALLEESNDLLHVQAAAQRRADILRAAVELAQAQPEQAQDLLAWAEAIPKPDFRPAAVDRLASTIRILELVREGRYTMTDLVGERSDFSVNMRAMQADALAAASRKHAEWTLRIVENWDDPTIVEAVEAEFETIGDTDPVAAVWLSILWISVGPEDETRARQAIQEPISELRTIAERRP